MKPIPGDIERYMAILGETPGFIARVAGGMPESLLRMSPIPDEWSMVELLAHLSACAEQWGHDINRMLRDEKPSFRNPHPRQVMKVDRFQSPAFTESLSRFTAARAELIDTLNSLEPEQWQRSMDGYTHCLPTCGGWHCMRLLTASSLNHCTRS
jgi:hypothetical protein